MKRHSKDPPKGSAKRGGTPDKVEGGGAAKGGNGGGKKRKAASGGKQKGTKKPKDMPRRPMSAYNVFFQEQRSVMLEEARRRQMLGQGATEGNKIGFESMAKIIGQCITLVSVFCVRF